jgi:hypothetical protein
MFSFLATYNMMISESNTDLVSKSAVVTQFHLTSSFSLCLRLLPVGEFVLILRLSVCLFTEALRAIDEAGCDHLTRTRVREAGELPGALWHIYQAQDADRIRDFLNMVRVVQNKPLT